MKKYFYSLIKILSHQQYKFNKMFLVKNNTGKNNLQRIIIFVFLTFTFVDGQFVEKWRVDQDLYETGVVMFDLNKDSVADLTKYLWNNITVYDGNNNYSVLWSVTDEDYEVLNLWNVYERNEGESDLAVFISSNYYDTLTTAITGYEVLADESLWKTSELQGSYSYVDVADVDNDLTLEVILGLNVYNQTDSSYSGVLYIIDGNTGSMEWISNPFQGYLVGPYVANIDDDITKEIVLNVYDYNNESYFLSVWSFDDGTNRVVDLDGFGPMEQLPSYPNPFNSSTIIPFILDGTSSVIIDIVNLNGQQIKRLTNQKYSPGKFQVRWNGRNDNNQNVSSGVYLVKMSINGKINTRPIVLTK